MDQQIDILNIQKSDSLCYDFLLAVGDRNKDNYFMNIYIGLPSIPLIGKYWKNNYEFNDVKSLVAIECFFDSQTQKFICNNQQIINLPQEVLQIISNVPELIKHNKSEGNQNQQQQGGGQNQGKQQNNQNKNQKKKYQDNQNYKQKQNNQFKGNQKYQQQQVQEQQEDENDENQDNQLQNTIKEQQQQEQQVQQVQEEEEKCQNNNNNNKNKQQQQGNKKSNAPDYNPTTYQNAFNINVQWSISFQNQNIDHKNDQNFMNLVCHPYLFQEIVFDKQKRKFLNVPVCLVIPKDIENTCGIYEWEKDSKNISVNQLRSEYVSCHMKGQNLCFSPNNMKFEIIENHSMHHFWSVLLQEDGYHQVTYHWNYNFNNQFQEAQEIIKQSKDLRTLITTFEALYGENDEAVKHLKNLFYPKQQ